MINQQVPQIDDIMGGVIPDEDEEEECDDEDCEYCRQYYLEQMQLMNEVVPEKEEIKMPIESSTKIVVQ